MVNHSDGIIKILYAMMSPELQKRFTYDPKQSATLTQEQVAQQVGKGRVVIANAVRLLTLPSQIQAWIGTGDLSVGHAKVLLGLERAEEQLLAAERIRKENLTVRATERLIDSMRAGTKPATKRKAAAASASCFFSAASPSWAAFNSFVKSVILACASSHLLRVMSVLSSSYCLFCSSRCSIRSRCSLILCW